MGNVLRRGFGKRKPRLVLFPGLSRRSKNEAAAWADWDVNTNPEKTKKIGTAVTKGCDKTVWSLKRQSCILYVELPQVFWQCWLFRPNVTRQLCKAYSEIVLKKSKNPLSLTLVMTASKTPCCVLRTNIGLTVFIYLLCMRLKQFG